jgi:hypothetical protein
LLLKQGAFTATSKIEKQTIVCAFHYEHIAMQHFFEQIPTLIGHKNLYRHQTPFYNGLKWKQRT